MQRPTLLLLLGILRPSLGLLVWHRGSLDLISGRHMGTNMVEEAHVVIVTVLGVTLVILRRLWLSRRHGCYSSHRCLWSSIARTLMAVILLRKLRRRCILEGTLVVQSLLVDIDSRSRLVLSSYWVCDSIFTMVWPFLCDCWLRMLGCRGLRL